MEPNRPRGRERNVTGRASIHRRGEGLHTGPVGAGRGAPSSMGHRGSGAGQQRGPSQRAPLPRGGLLKLLPILLAAAIFAFGGKFLFGSSGQDAAPASTQNVPSNSAQSTGSGGLSGLGSFLGGFSGASSSSGWDYGDNTGKLDDTTAPGTREKRTKLLGSGQDTVTLMVYMCGTDLESRSGMATSDLQEMLSAKLSGKVNVLVCTGGCKAWKNNAISNSVGQIYQVGPGGLRCLVADRGTASMTDPANLSSFLQYCHQNYPANREMLIFWDHGGGSVSGYGYDETHPGSGSMTLSGIDRALEDAGIHFDCIGFDACLMATVETALMLDEHADYLIASEETEPGVGWYYTDWLSELSTDPSLPTIELGKRIADSFVDVCARQCRGQKTTLSVIDLAEAAATVPAPLNAFAKETTERIRAQEYKAVSDARFASREFAQSSAIDQVDLVHLAKNLKTDAGDQLAEALLGAVKYNRTSSNMTNAYGLSAYFPYRKASRVDSAVDTYEKIGMDSDYSRCIQAFASMEASGQAVAGGSEAASPLPSLLGGLGSLGGNGGADALSEIVGGLFSGQSGFLSGKALDAETAAAYVSAHRFDPSELAWSGGEVPSIQLDEAQWELVQDIALNVFYDDGAGYIDLGLDNILPFSEDGALLGTYDEAWLAIDGQVVPYYYENTVDDGTHYTITGHVPALLNGERVDLILVFDDSHPYGYVAGAVSDYRDGETETVAKSMTALQDGDTLDFVCDYYSYDGGYQDSYFLGEQHTVSGELKVSDLEIDAANCTAAYRFTDIYQQHYWTETLPG